MVLQATKKVECESKNLTLLGTQPQQKQQQPEPQLEKT